MDGLDEPGGAVPDVSGSLWPRDEAFAAVVGEWGEDPAADYRRASMPASTRAAYAGDWDRFTRWCAQTNAEPLPAAPGVVSRYLAAAADLIDEAGAPAYATATLTRWVAGINAAHRAAGLPAPGADPLVTETLRGIRATRAQPPRRAKPLRLAQLEAVLAGVETRYWPGAVIGRRDRALLLLGFAGALRRSELAALQIRDVELDADGVVTVRIRMSKTDQDATGQTVAYPRGTTRANCTACAVLDWAVILGAWTDGARVAVLQTLTVARTKDPSRHACTDPDAREAWAQMGERDPYGPLLRPVTKAATITPRPISGATVAGVVRTRLADAGIDPTGYSGHSLRAGFVTDAFTAGATAHEIMRQTRHTSPATLEAYARHYAPLDANAVTKIGL